MPSILKQCPKLIMPPDLVELSRIFCSSRSKVRKKNKNGECSIFIFSIRLGDACQIVSRDSVDR